MPDELDTALRNIQSDVPEARQNLSKEEKLKLVKKWGPKRVAEILKAKGQIPDSRLPFIFNNVDTQDLLDILSNDMSEVLPKE